MKKIFFAIITNFQIPLFVLAGIIVYGITFFLHYPIFTMLIMITSVLLGSFQLIQETVDDILHKRFALDYIAILAVVVALITHEYVVAMVIALMLSTGRTLEEYGSKKAHQSLGQLADRIPHEVLLIKNETTQTV